MGFPSVGLGKKIGNRLLPFGGAKVEKTTNHVFRNTLKSHLNPTFSVEQCWMRKVGKIRSAFDVRQNMKNRKKQAK